MSSSFKESFGDVYDQHVRELFSFIYYKTHHKETAEDLTSQVFTKALSKIGRFDPNKGTIRSWLYEIARNTVVDFYRTHKSEQSIEDAWGIASSDDPLARADVAISFAQVRPYLQSLSSEQRDIITMRVWQEMSYAEIAEALGKSEASCKMAYSRGIAVLRKSLPPSAFLFFLMMS